mmetsp:Transcript_1522/g.4043  ORF Transcript_1522/g.4043 Transcript_1522/m.4043 type:complete len:233 (+) Transcript_1522:383-1081(+)
MVNDPNLLRNLAKQPEIMAHQNHAAFKVVDGLGKRIDHLHIAMVGGLVQQQNVRLLQRNVRKHQARLKPVRKLFDRAQLRRASDPKPSDFLPPRLQVVVQTFEALLQVIYWREFEVKLVVRVLMVSTNAQPRLVRDGTLYGLQLLHDELEQRRLACAVGPDERDARFRVDAKVKIRVEIILLLSRVRERNVASRNCGRRELAWRREAESEYRIVVRFLDQPGLYHLVELLLA